MLAFTHKTGHYLSVDGAEIYYELLGDPEGKPLVLLHGGLGCITDLNVILEGIPSGYRVIGIDLRGHGKSTLGDKELNYSQYQRDVEAVLNHLELHSLSMFGFSDGGIVSYRLAAAGNLKVERLITLGSQWRLKINDPSIEFLGGVTSGDWKEMFPESVAYYNDVNPQPDFELLVEKVKNVWIDTSIAGYPNETVSDIRCPVLVMRGDDDFLFSLDEAVELVEQIENTKFMNIAYAEHEAHKESSDICCSIISQTLSCANET